jgi:hypothetical protein
MSPCGVVGARGSAGGNRHAGANLNPGGLLQDCAGSGGHCDPALSATDTAGTGCASATTPGRVAAAPDGHATAQAPSSSSAAGRQVGLPSLQPTLAVAVRASASSTTGPGTLGDPCESAGQLQVVTAQLQGQLDCQWSTANGSLRVLGRAGEAAAPPALASARGQPVAALCASCPRAQAGLGGPRCSCGQQPSWVDTAGTSRSALWVPASQPEASGSAQSTTHRDKRQRCRGPAAAGVHGPGEW